jgi:hypothetical protein
MRCAPFSNQKSGGPRVSAASVERYRGGKFWAARTSRHSLLSAWSSRGIRTSDISFGLLTASTGATPDREFASLLEKQVAMPHSRGHRSFQSFMTFVSGGKNGASRVRAADFGSSIYR